MLKKIIHVLILVGLLGAVLYKLSENMIKDAVDDTNALAVEIYADAIKIATLNNVMSADEIDYKNVKVATKVDCKEIKILDVGNVELHGCRVETSTRKYKYVNGKATRE